MDLKTLNTMISSKNLNHHSYNIVTLIFKYLASTLESAREMIADSAIALGFPETNGLFFSKIQNFKLR